MIERRDGRLCISAPMLISNARGLLEAGRAALQGKRETVDLGAVREADSSALAVMLGWLRTAEARGIELSFANLPAGLRSLADLYELTELVPLA